MRAHSSEAATMANLPKLPDFKKAVEAVRAELKEVDSQISELEMNANRIKRRPPHTDDIVSVFQRGIRNIKGNFESKFRTHLLGKYTGEGSSDTASMGKARNVLDLDFDRTDPRGGVIYQQGVAELNVQILTYFLGDAIQKEIPALVERLCPEAAKGLKSADRIRELRDIDAKLSELKSKRAALLDDLQAAQKTFHTPLDS